MFGIKLAVSINRLHLKVCCKPKGGSFWKKLRQQQHTNEKWSGWEGRGGSRVCLVKVSEKSLENGILMSYQGVQSFYEYLISKWCRHFTTWNIAVCGSTRHIHPHTHTHTYTPYIIHDARPPRIHCTLFTFLVKLLNTLVPMFTRGSCYS